MPAFRTLQVFVNACPAGRMALSAIVTSPRKSTRLQFTSSVGAGVGDRNTVAVGGVVGMGVRVGALIGVSVSVGVAVPVGSGVAVSVGVCVGRGVEDGVKVWLGVGV